MNMILLRKNNFLFLQLFLCIFWVTFHVTVSDTRYECISGGYGGPGYGYGDDYEADEGGVGRFWGSGTLTCPYANSGSILVLRVGYGSSIIPGRCESITSCKEEYDTPDFIADRCDGRPSCFISLGPPRYMSCGRSSNYMMVEYECVDTWKTFEICEQVSTVSRGSSVFLTSPGYLSLRQPAASRGTQMCECIIQSQDNADLFLDYLQTQLGKSVASCPYEYVLLESKGSLNQSTIDKEIELCGRRHIGSKWFQGSVRLTYASGGPMRRNGLIAKFIVDNIGNPPNIEVECGPVNASGLKLKAKPPALSEAQAPAIQRTRIPTDPWMDPAPPLSFFEPSRNLRADFDRYLSMDELEADEGPFDDAAGRLLPPMNPPLPPVGILPPPLNRLPPNPRPPNRPPSLQNSHGQGQPPDLRNWKINIPDTPAPGPAVLPSGNNNGPVKRQPIAKTPQSKRKPAPPPKQQKPRKVNPTLQARPNPQNRGPNNRLRNIPAKRPVPNQGGPQTKRQTPRKVAHEQADISKNSPEDANDTGSYVALVMAAIGAVLIVGSFGIIALHNYRKRQRIKAKEAEYAISGGSATSTYGQGWEMDDGSIYATIADIDKHGTACVNPAVSQELDLDTETCFVDRFVGQEEEHEELRDGKNPVNAEPAQESDVANEFRNKEIAVIEVHQNFEGSNATEKHEEGCLPANEYSTVNKQNGETNLCASCNISRPPRRRDLNRGYDNNVGVKDKRE